MTSRKNRKVILAAYSVQTVKNKKKCVSRIYFVLILMIRVNLPIIKVMNSDVVLKKLYTP